MAVSLSDGTMAWPIGDDGSTFAIPHGDEGGIVLTRVVLASQLPNRKPHVSEPAATKMSPLSPKQEEGQSIEWQQLLEAEAKRLPWPYLEPLVPRDKILAVLLMVLGQRVGIPANVLSIILFYVSRLVEVTLEGDGDLHVWDVLEGKSLARVVDAPNNPGRRQSRSFAVCAFALSLFLQLMNVVRDSSVVGRTSRVGNNYRHLCCVTQYVCARRG
jgi:hypothetical protein